MNKRTTTRPHFTIPHDIIIFLARSYSAGISSHIAGFYKTHGILPSTFGDKRVREDYAAFMFNRAKAAASPPPQQE